NAVVSHLDLQDLVKMISASLRDILPHDSAGIALYEPEFNHLREYSNVSYKDLSAFRVGDTIPLEGTPAGEVYVTGKSLLVKHPNLEQYPADRYSQLTEEGSPKSACLVPLTTHGRKLGIAGVSSTQPNYFTARDLELFEHVSDQIAIAVENSLNYERANRERVRAQMLLEISNAITTNLDLHELIQATSACLRNYFQHDFSGVALWNDETNQMSVHSLAEPNKYLVEGRVFPIEGTLTGLAFTTGQPIVRNRYDPDESSWSLSRKFQEEHSLKAMCFIPMIWGDRAVGVLNLGCRREDAFSESDIELLTHIAGQVAIAFQNSLNFQRATKAKERTQTLLDASNAIAKNLDLRELLRTTSTCLRGYFNHDVTGLALYDEDTNKLMVHAIDRHDNSQFAAEGTAFSLDGSMMGQAFTSGQPILEWRIDNETEHSPQMKAAYDAGWRSGACVPLITRDRKLGVLGLASLRDDAFSEIDADLLINIAGQVALAVENVMQYRQIESLKNKLASEKGYLEEEIKTQYNFAEIVGQSSALLGVLKQVETVAPTDSTVLLIGETGTGKELIARAIHDLSSRNERTLVKLNCAAIPTGLLESELFGHEKGAFTGAVTSRVGRFELAHQGTLLLDEIGEIPLDLQPKLLRVLQEHEFERLGSSRTIKTNARLIAATNCDLAKMVADKTFRSDLFYRLNVFPIMIPPLRERSGDIPLLVGYLTQKHAARMNKHIRSIPAPTMEALCNYHWPGNVRELENFVERSVILSRGAELESPLTELQTVNGSAAAASVGTSAAAADGQSAKPKLGTMDDMERTYIEEVLRHANGMIAGKGGAAEILGMPSSTLRSRMKKLGIK
ncbi:MAG TPA: sigma 54-interacting transcriptional regulator, partial [Pyrinomonadaceae bacterium]|nr:sigma 54-interacting transcriptional regulator [Pyrinomonadaceae bacterium]